MLESSEHVAQRHFLPGAPLQLGLLAPTVSATAVSFDVENDNGVVATMVLGEGGQSRLVGPWVENVTRWFASQGCP